MPFQPGNKYGGARQVKPFRDALMIELKAAGEDMPELRKIARTLINVALNPTSKGQIAACKEVADRLDGRVPQAIIGDDDEPAFKTETIIRRIIVDRKENPLS